MIIANTLREELSSNIPFITPESDIFALMMKTSNNHDGSDLTIILTESEYESLACRYPAGVAGFFNAFQDHTGNKRLSYCTASIDYGRTVIQIFNEKD